MITFQTEKGKKLLEFLEEEYGLPTNTKSFSLEMGVDTALTIDCVFYPVDSVSKSTFEQLKEELSKKPIRLPCKEKFVKTATLTFDTDTVAEDTSPPWVE
jgi:hypothetical protein